MRHAGKAFQPGGSASFADPPFSFLVAVHVVGELFDLVAVHVAGELLDLTAITSAAEISSTLPPALRSILAVPCTRNHSPGITSADYSVARVKPPP